MKLISKTRLSSAPWSWLPCVSAPLQRKPLLGPGAGQCWLPKGDGGDLSVVAGMVLLVFAIQQKSVGVQNRLAVRGG